MRAREAKTIPIATYLASEGHNPATSKKSGAELWYSSPIRKGDSNPSFCVNTERNIWYDHGIADGGDVIKLVQDLRQVTVKEALAILERLAPFSSLSSRNHLPPPNQKNLLAGKKEKNPLQVLRVSEIHSPALVQYLESRKISLELGQRYFKEISYTHAEQNKTYFALGFPSGDGYEVRNPLFKGFVGENKAPTAFNLQNHVPLSIFEGAFDFLSFLEHHKKTELQSSVLVLNSVNLRKQALELLQGYQFTKIYLFLDNDEGGETTKRFFMDHFQNAQIVDKSGIYSGFADYNEWWCKY